jgi:hypothetical protein
VSENTACGLPVNRKYSCFIPVCLLCNIGILPSMLSVEKAFLNKNPSAVLKPVVW